MSQSHYPIPKQDGIAKIIRFWIYDERYFVDNF